ncbi:hypothetical protein KEM55_005287, partial [Ascosphaera atra]
NRTHEATLAPSFASLQQKKLDMELAVDPLFKKASADFDEGGAKGLLLNNLSIDGEGRIVFDSSDDAVDDPKQEPEEGNEDADKENQPTKPHYETVDVDISSLANKFFPDIDLLSEQTVCPSLKDFDLGGTNDSLDIPFLRAPEEWKNDAQSEAGAGFGEPSGIMLDDDMATGFDDDDDATITGFDMGGEAGFGQGGEAWAREAALEGGPQLIGVGDGEGEAGDGTVIDGNDPFAISLAMGNLSAAQEQESILSYFDNALKKNWAGPEHWKIRRIKEANANTSTATAKPRREKEAFEIDFAKDLDPSVAELIYTPAASNAAISMPKTQWKTKGRNLLPDDKHFNSRQLLRLFLKPRARMGFGSRRRLAGGRSGSGPGQIPNATDIDENFWAQQKQEQEGAQGTYDADFFADDDGLAFPDGLPDDDDENAPFVDAPEGTNPADLAAGGGSGLAALLNNPDSQAGGQGFGSQLVTQGGRRVRPEYVAYARTAKKVDVRRLKDTMWKGIGDKLPESAVYDSGSAEVAITREDELDAQKENEVLPEPIPQATDGAGNQGDTNGEGMGDLDNSTLRFTSVMNGLKSSYPEPALKDIST